MKTILATLAVAALLSPVLAQAADFGSVDTNADGVVTWEELNAAMPDVTEDQFKAADADSSGGLDATEFATLAG